MILNFKLSFGNTIWYWHFDCKECLEFFSRLTWWSVQRDQNFSYWKKLQKLNIHSNTGKTYNSPAEIRKNRHTHTHTKKHTHTHTTSPYVTRMICNRRYWVVRYQKILINLGTIRKYKLDQTFYLCCMTWEDLFFLDYV